MLAFEHLRKSGKWANFPDMENLMKNTYLFKTKEPRCYIVILRSKKFNH